MFSHSGLVHDVSALEIIADESNECTQLLAGAAPQRRAVTTDCKVMHAGSWAT